MKVLLVDVDSKIPNIALGKISTYHKERKDEVVFVRLGFKGHYHRKERFKTINAKGFDKVYVSNIFVKNQNLFKIVNCDKVLIGGVGSINMKKKLPKKIDSLNIDYSLWPDNDRSYGFITRGCIRKCKFCFVPKTEGNLYKYNNIKNIVKHDKVCFMDNNILAYDKHLEILQELVDMKIECQFNQGLDIRLITHENAKLLSKLRYLSKRTFAFDDIKYKPVIEKKIKIVKKYIPSDWIIRFFIYCNANMPIQDTITRLKWCRDNKCLPYLMTDENCSKSNNKEFYSSIRNYCNFAVYFCGKTYEEYVKLKTKNKKLRREFVAMWNGEIENINKPKVQKEWWK